MSDTIKLASGQLDTDWGKAHAVVQLTGKANTMVKLLKLIELVIHGYLLPLGLGRTLFSVGLSGVVWNMARK